MSITFQLVDVFGSGPFTGNPVAVYDGQGLDTETMQQIARWMNLSETTFLLPPTSDEGDYRVRIFTLERELPFAGHPTLGTCHAWAERTGSTKDCVIQECEAGLITVERRGGRWAFEAPPLIRTGAVEEPLVAEVADFLKIDRSKIVEAEWVDNGPGWLGILLGSAEEVLALEPVSSYPRRMDVGVIGPYPDGHELAFELRTFFSNHVGAIVEDPVTGSFQASAAEWMIRSGRGHPPYVTAQGTQLGRSGRAYIDHEGDRLWIGGQTETLALGDAPFRR
ncbi:PhzF family phenazine biosynthesis protein [Sphingomonas daechungensis]|uniref:PhzF family phenazine biosynthesis protein n=1 Tax=Sphingomonas daechungensis TaxID=1176646 RepID=UPI0037830ADA